MIKFENTEVMNFDGAIRGMRNPLNSWGMSDSRACELGCDIHTMIVNPCHHRFTYHIGPKDLDLMKRLIKAGSDHRKFMRQIFVSVDITAPLYWWKEFDTYKVGTVANSCSTMHKIADKEFTLEDFSFEKLSENMLGVLVAIIGALNSARAIYLDTNDKNFWRDMIQILPTSYNQRRTVTLSYENVYAIYHSDRRTHKLDEWRVGVMRWIESLPYAEELLIDRS